MAVLFTSSSAGYQSLTKAPTSNQEPTDVPKLNLAEERDSYAVYSAVLRGRKPSVENWKIVHETSAFTFCLNSTQNAASRYRSVLDDYTMKNKGKLILERKFDLAAYTIVSPQEWFGRAPWADLATVSAVGFNIDRTRAAICYSVGTSAGSSGTCLFLVKQDDKWKTDEDIHEGCGFGGAGAVYR
jgi:hypothetical protein